jgi:hypothetical protein
MFEEIKIKTTYAVCYLRCIRRQGLRLRDKEIWKDAGKQSDAISLFRQMEFQTKIERIS